MCWQTRLAAVRTMATYVCGSKVRRAPLVVVVGVTGSGKTKLGVELARAFPAEIISADSMQVYKGLDVVTAKPTPAERAAAPHHLVDFVEPHLSFSVVDFRDRALNIIDDIMASNKVPVVVGGTNYYVESVLWHTLIEREADDNKELVCERERKRTHDKANKPSAVTDPAEERLREDLAARIAGEREGKCTMTTEELHEKLQEIDPGMTLRLHPNDRRKICRALEVYCESGQRQSELLAAQAEREKRLRYPDRTIVLWLTCEREEHDRRMDARVDKMLTDGLVKEMLDYHANYNAARLAEGQAPDYTKGIFQTLGFKEFHEYLILDQTQRSTPLGRALLERGLEDMKRATRRFAHRQEAMVRSRFLNHPTREIPPIYELETTDLSQFDVNVRDKAVSIVLHHIRGTVSSYAPLKPSDGARDRTLTSLHATHRCVSCDRFFIGDAQFNQHLHSNRHKRQMQALRRGGSGLSNRGKLSTHSDGQTADGRSDTTNDQSEPPFSENASEDGALFVENGGGASHHRRGAHHHPPVACCCGLGLQAHSFRDFAPRGARESRGYAHHGIRGSQSSALRGARSSRGFVPHGTRGSRGIAARGARGLARGRVFRRVARGFNAAKSAMASTS